MTITNETLSLYAARMKEDERSEATMEKYMRDVSRFAAWLGDRALDRNAVIEWKELLVEQGRSPVTVNAALSAINGLLRLLGREDCRVKFLKVQRQVFRDQARELTREEYRRLVQTARDLGRTRIALIMETICACGIRVSELRAITVEAARRGQAVITLKGKTRRIMLPERLCRRLLKYAKKQKRHYGEIFVSSSGKSLDRRRIWAEMKEICQRAGVMTIVTQPGKKTFWTG